MVKPPSHFYAEFRMYPFNHYASLTDLLVLASSPCCSSEAAFVRVTASVTFGIQECIRNLRYYLKTDIYIGHLALVTSSDISLVQSSIATLPSPAIAGE
jgi:hypothetical protein